jgi:uncharacterized membrane-anchored protein
MIRYSAFLFYSYELGPGFTLNSYAPTRILIVNESNHLRKTEMNAAAVILLLILWVVAYRVLSSIFSWNPERMTRKDDQASL